MSALMTVLATVEGAAEEEGSKTLFYVAGGVLASWAVLVSLAGMRGSFPGNEGAARAIYAISAVLVATACASAVLTG